MVEFLFDSNDFQKSIKNTIDKAIVKASRKSGDYMIDQMDKAFDTEGKRPGTQIWEPTSIAALLSRKTAPKSGTFSQRLFQMANAKTLVDTGKLRRSINFLLGSLGFSRKGNQTITRVGANVDYIETHEKGGKYKGRDVPARPNQFYTDKDIEVVTDFFIEELKRA